jgi:hypothetical protein
MLRLSELSIYEGATSVREVLTRKYKILFVPDPTRALNMSPTDSTVHEWMDVTMSGGQKLVVNPNLQGFVFLQHNSGHDKQGESSVHIHEKVRGKANIIPTTTPTQVTQLLAIHCSSMAAGI